MDIGRLGSQRNEPQRHGDPRVPIRAGRYGDHPRDGVRHSGPGGIGAAGCQRGEKASQPAIAITPPAVSVTQGQTIAFAASGGATGNYAWGGSASGGGASQSATFSSVGTYAVSVIDSGNANYNPSTPATAIVNVQEAPSTRFRSRPRRVGPFRGAAPHAYPPNAVATAVATPNAGNSFAGWSGDLTGNSPSLSVVMNSSKSILATFTPLLAQIISFVPPGAVYMGGRRRSPLSVTSSSGLPVALTLDSGPASISGVVVTPA